MDAFHIQVNAMMIMHFNGKTVHYLPYDYEYETVYDRREYIGNMLNNNILEKTIFIGNDSSENTV